MKQTTARIALAELIDNHQYEFAVGDQLHGKEIVELLDTPEGQAIQRALASERFKEELADLREKWARLVESSKRSKR